MLVRKSANMQMVNRSFFWKMPKPFTPPLEDRTLAITRDLRWKYIVAKKQWKRNTVQAKMRKTSRPPVDAAQTSCFASFYRIETRPGADLSILANVHSLWVFSSCLLYLSVLASANNNTKASRNEALVRLFLRHFVHAGPSRTGSVLLVKTLALQRISGNETNPC